MKIVCNFCKTEYGIDRMPAGPVSCVVCGHTWVPPVPRAKNSFLVFIAAIVALLAVLVFAIVIVGHHHADNIKDNPLVAKVSSITTVVDAFGVSHFVVSGTITNQSEDIYGVPDLLILSKDAEGDIVSTQKFMPVATLLDAGASVAFSHTLSAPTTGIKKVTVEFKE